MRTEFIWRTGLLGKKKEKKRKKEKEKKKKKRLKFRVFRMNISLTHLCIDFATGAFYSVRSAIHMRSNVSTDAKIDIAATEIRERESERKRAS